MDSNTISQQRHSVYYTERIFPGYRNFNELEGFSTDNEHEIWKQVPRSMRIVSNLVFDEYEGNRENELNWEGKQSRFNLLCCF